jgi:hypothetical protein
MTRPSRGISDIQEKARGKTNMTKLKAGMAPLKKKDVIKAKVTKRAPTPDLAQLGAMRGMYKGGSVDGIAKKGKTRGKIT